MSQENTIIYHEEFVSKLETIYGKFNPDNNKFESTSNSKIARDLCYSDSQFSRLINNTASEGEFKRALRNVTRLLNEKRMEQGTSTSVENSSGLKKSRIIYILGFIIILLLGCLAFNFYTANDDSHESAKASRFQMLEWSFENQYIKPYVKLKELPDDCNYPCYKYQGKWKLKNEYRLPFFRERNGFHYVAKDAVMYARCMDETSSDGSLFEGYEYQLHEIWYDKRELPIDSFLMESNKTKIREEYNSMNLEEDENFIKIALVHTFFRNTFSIDSTLINRQGKVIGRDIEFLPNEDLKIGLGSENLVNDVKSEINSIAKNRLEDFSKPINCEPTQVPNTDFHYIKNGDELTFSCQFTTGRFLVDYEKTFVLEDQYINNICR